MKQFISLILSLSLGFGHVAGANPTALPERASDENTREYIITEGTAALTVTLDDDADIEQVSETLEQLPEHSERNVILSTDSVAVTETVGRWASARKKLAQVAYMPFGKLLNYGKHLGQRAKSDKIGLMVITVTTAYDSLLWIHSTDYTLEQRSAMIAFNLAMAVAFGVDKDSWAKLARGSERRISALINMVAQRAEPSYKRRLITTFLANAGLSALVQAGRFSILSMDHLAQALTTFSFWGSALALGTAFTFSGFGWGEQLADIDEKKHPMSKWLGRRLMEIRAVVVGTAAPTSKLMQPDVWGPAPWIALALNGTIGLAFWLKTDRMVNWIEYESGIKEKLKTMARPPVIARTAGVLAISAAILGCGPMLESRRLPPLPSPTYMAEDPSPLVELVPSEP